MPVLAYIIVAVAAYLLGSIPTGFLVAKAGGIDIQKSGSGNIGATNAMRVLGKPAGIFVMLVDATKGFLSVVILPNVFVLLIFQVPSPDYLRSYQSFNEEPNAIQNKIELIA